MRALILLLLLVSITVNAQKIPLVDLEDLDGETISTSIFNTDDHKPIVITFWATWCIPCLNELSFVNDVYENWQQQYKFGFYAVSIDDDRTVRKVLPLVNGKNWPFTVLIDPNQDFKRMLNINTIPYLIVVKNGEIIFKKTGFVKGDELKIEEIIAKNQ